MPVKRQASSDNRQARSSLQCLRNQLTFVVLQGGGVYEAFAERRDVSFMQIIQQIWIAAADAREGYQPGGSTDRAAIFLLQLCNV